MRQQEEEKPMKRIVKQFHCASRFVALHFFSLGCCWIFGCVATKTTCALATGSGDDGGDDGGGGVISVYARNTMHSHTHT